MTVATIQLAEKAPTYVEITGMRHLTPQHAGTELGPSGRAWDGSHATGAHAVAMGFLACAPLTLATLREGLHPHQGGDDGGEEPGATRQDTDPAAASMAAALGEARIAGILAAKNASGLIPACRPAMIASVDVELDVVEGGVAVSGIVSAPAGHDVEMHALTGASIAALTLYEHLRQSDSTARLTSLRTVTVSQGLRAEPGQGPHAQVAELPVTSAAMPQEVVPSVALVITVSDRCASGEATDTIGPLISTRLAELGIAAGQALVPHETAAVAAAIRQGVSDGVGLVITAGGTGVGPRDVTPQATAPILTARLDRLADSLNTLGDPGGHAALLSRGLAGLAGRTVVINLPGSASAVAGAMTHLADVLPHLLEEVNEAGTAG